MKKLIDRQDPRQLLRMLLANCGSDPTPQRFYRLFETRLSMRSPLEIATK
ncbi:MAG: hypothetical protein PUP93_12140 [Rhizonema sp. NSF051]|nr:hypothetical protein [Rhizonema sp. NSF051]